MLRNLLLGRLSFPCLLLCSLLCVNSLTVAKQCADSGYEGLGRALEASDGPTRRPFARRATVRRTLLATETQRKCFWNPSTGSFAGGGTCELNDYFILTLRGAPPSISARILAFMHYKYSVCASYNTEAACFANAADACAWDRTAAAAAAGGSGGCYLSTSALYDPEVLRGRLYCDGSLLDAAARCALAPPAAAAASGVASGTAATGAITSVGGCGWVPGADCALVTAEQLGGGGQVLSTAAISYLRLAGLVTYTGTDPDEVAEAGRGGVCMARWMLQSDTLERLQRTVAANPSYGLLQPDLLGSCNGTAWLVKALAAAAATCSAAATSGSDVEARRASCVAASGCRWVAATSACEPGYDMLYDALYDQNDPWVRAVSEADDHCAAAGGASKAACDATAAAAPSLDVNPARMVSLRTALSDPAWVLDGGSSGGDGGGGGGGGGGQGGGAGAPARAGGGATWLMAIVGAAAAALLGGRGGGGIRR